MQHGSVLACVEPYIIDQDDRLGYHYTVALHVVLFIPQIDPHRVWKGAWRWYHEDMLSCCIPLEHIKKNGITMEEFACLAGCNTLQVCK